MPKKHEHNTTRKTALISAYAGSDGRTDGKDSDAWYTPAQYLESAREVLGGFDLDPFSSESANEVVQASRYFTVEDDALTLEWHAETLWMNPPYSRSVCAPAVDRLVREFEARRVENAIALTNNATDTKWFKTLAGAGAAVCFTDHRIAFWNEDGKPLTGNTRGQTFTLLTRSDLVVERFAEEFAKHGLVFRRMSDV